MRPATFPAANNVVALCDQIGNTPEVEVRESFPKTSHERLDVFTTAARFVQGILQKHVRRGKFVDDCRVPGSAPESFEPLTYDDLVYLLLGHKVGFCAVAQLRS